MAEQPTAELTTETTGEPCAGCGFPLAADQRYCLNCGRRHGDPRIDYVPYLNGTPEDASPAVAPTVETVAAPAAIAPREPSPMVAVVGIALLGLMLLVGVLIGRGGGDEVAPAPQVVTVDDGTSASTAGAGADTGSGEGSAGGGSDPADAGSKTGAGGGGGGGDGGGEPVGDVGSGSGTTDDPAVVDPSVLDDIEGKTGAEQQEASENLPDAVATPGEAPPTDNEEPGAGASPTVIK